jgi:hypothetical protein
LKHLTGSKWPVFSEECIVRHFLCFLSISSIHVPHGKYNVKIGYVGTLIITMFHSVNAINTTSEIALNLHALCSIHYKCEPNIGRPICLYQRVRPWCNEYNFRVSKRGRRWKDMSPQNTSESLQAFGLQAWTNVWLLNFL